MPTEATPHRQKRVPAVRPNKPEARMCNPMNPAPVALVRETTVTAAGGRHPDRLGAARSGRKGPHPAWPQSARTRTTE